MKESSPQKDVGGRPGTAPAAQIKRLVLTLGVWCIASVGFADSGLDARAGAQSLARALSAAIEPYQQTAREAAQSADVIRALQQGQSDVLEDVARAVLRDDLPGVLALRILAADTRDADLALSPPLTYASISMLRRAGEAGRAPDAELHLPGAESEHLVLVEPVVGAAAADEVPPLLGFIHLSVAGSVLRDAFARNAPQQGRVRLKQGNKTSIAVLGDAPAGGVIATASVPGTTFSIKFTGAQAAASQANGQTLPVVFIGVAAVIAVGLLAGWFLWRRRSASKPSSGKSESVILQGAIKAILDGAHPGLEHLLPRSRGRIGARVDTDANTIPRARGDDVTAFAASPLDGSQDPTVPREMANEDSDAAEAKEPIDIPASIFRTYDIRGIVGDTLTEDGVYQIGRALGAEADARGQKTVIVARDGRHSGTPLKHALIEGLLESGRDVVDIGEVPTPVLYFATHFLDTRSGVMITGSHNPAEYNGLKIVLDGETLSGNAIQAIRQRIKAQDFVNGTGRVENTDILAEYIRRISEEIPVSLSSALKVVVDCGNGVPGIVAPAVLRAIGHDVIELFCDVDGDFPNHHPDPSQPENLTALIKKVAEEGADLGLAFDGDGDRLGVIDSNGNIVWPDRQMMLFSRDILARNPGAKIIFDVKCSRMLPDDITAHGGQPIMSRTGHSIIKAQMIEQGALLAGEMSGHIFFKERWYGFDDAIYAAARLLEIIVNSELPVADLFASVPGGVATPELRLNMPEDEHADFMRRVVRNADFPDGAISTLDGLRVDFPDSWGLIRPSNTTPCLVLRFEGDDEDALEEVKDKFRALLSGVEATLDLPF